MARTEGHNVDGVSTNWNGVYSWDKNKNYLTLASDAYECTYLVKKVGMYYKFTINYPTARSYANICPNLLLKPTEGSSD